MFASAGQYHSTQLLGPVAGTELVSLIGLSQDDHLDNRWLGYWFFFFSSRRRHTRSKRDWSSNVCSSDLLLAKVAVPKARCIVTMTQSRLLVIVRAPRPTCATRNPTLVKEKAMRRRSGRNQRTETAKVARRNRVVRAATRRWAYSTATRGSPRSGTTWPLQSGQSGQASPAPIPRTVPPRTIVVYAQIAPAMAIIWRSRRRSIGMRIGGRRSESASINPR